MRSKSFVLLVAVACASYSGAFGAASQYRVLSTQSSLSGQPSTRLAEADPTGRPFVRVAEVNSVRLPFSHQAGFDAAENTTKRA